MKDNLYNTRGKAPNNFPQHLTPQLAQLAQQVVKENYDFGFATVSHEKYDESELAMGVATYNNIRIKDMLPTQEQLKERMELLKKELRQTKRLMNKE